MHAQFIKNIPSMYHAKALVPFSPNFKMAICHLTFIYSQLLGNRGQFFEVFIFFYHVSLVYRREKTWRSDDSTLSFDQIFTDILFSFCFFLCLNYSFHHPQKMYYSYSQLCKQLLTYHQQHRAYTQFVSAFSRSHILIAIIIVAHIISYIIIL